nr:MAG TPA: hypothetical protein [Crassvirales sp.]
MHGGCAASSTNKYRGGLRPAPNCITTELKVLLSL